MLSAQNCHLETLQHQRSAQFPLYQAPNSTTVRRSVEVFPYGVEGELYSGTGTHGLPSSSPQPFSTFNSLPATTIPRYAARADSTNLDASAASSPASLSQLSGSANNDDLSAPPLVLSSPSPSDLMHHPDSTWLATGQLTPKSLSRLSHHHRESSLSSLGSAGPASPYSQNASNPHIAVTDSAADAYSGLATGEDYNYQLSKTPNEHFFPGYSNYGPDVALGQAFATSQLLRKGDNAMLPPPDYSSVQTRSRPVSVASSVASESPAAPSLGEPEANRRRKNVNTDFSSVPKLDRTMTDIYSDELYSPHFAITSASPSQSSQLAVSPHSDIFNQRLLAANSQHLNAPQSPISMTSRGRSPFRQGSPLAPAPSHNFPESINGSQIGFGSAQRIRDQVKMEQDAHVLQQQVARNDAGINTPQTISPKDAMLEYTEPDSDANFPLFPQQQHHQQEQHQQQQQQHHHHHHHQQQQQQQQQQQDASAQSATYAQSTKPMAAVPTAYDGMGLGGTNFNFSNTQLPIGLQIPQQYPFISQARHQLSSLSPGNTSMMSSPVSSVGSAGLSARQNGTTHRPNGLGEGGTYTCTYHGCTLRFETPALLQKHKREGHRQAHGLGGARRPEPINTTVAAAGMTSSLLNSQAGPHRCDRINPSTGKSCNTVFSRPYDLTRHEDTIHNARKQKVRCQLCTDEKTFSRADALTRHFRVCHPDVDLPGKHRRRHLQS